MKRIKHFIAAFTIAVFGLALVPVTTSYAYDPLATTCDGGANASNEVCQNRDEDAGSLIALLINVLLFLVGSLAVIMIIWAGISYTTSAGDAAKVTRAKNTLTYSIVGLVVAFIAYAIVKWVLDIL